MMPPDSQKELLSIARQTVEAVVKRQPIPQFAVTDPALMGHQGAFVTLRTHGDLRGCIGTFVSDEPLCQTIPEMAKAATTDDWRFINTPLRPQELADLHIEISVLSPLQRIKDPLAEIQLGTHGIYIKRGGASGCFLPQVATETGWSKEEFLSQCCAGKAGLSPNAWKDPSTEVYVFTAQILEEQ